MELYKLAIFIKLIIKPDNNKPNTNLSGKISLVISNQNNGIAKKRYKKKDII